MLFAMIGFSIRVPIHVSATLFQIQLPVNMPGKTAEDGPIAWVLDTHVRNQDFLLLALAWPNLGHNSHLGNELADAASFSATLPFKQQTK